MTVATLVAAQIEAVVSLVSGHFLTIVKLKEKEKETVDYSSSQTFFF